MGIVDEQRERATALARGERRAREAQEVERRGPASASAGSRCEKGPSGMARPASVAVTRTTA